MGTDVSLVAAQVKVWASTYWSPQPEGSEVRRFADLLNAALNGKPIVAITARTRGAKVWLDSQPEVLAD